MKYIHRPEVNKQIAERSHQNIDSVNAFMDNMRGTVVAVKRIRSGQSRGYADSVDEALIFCYCPNVFTTGGPTLRSISKKEAEAIARIFVANWSDNPQFLESRLDFLVPNPNPCGLTEYKSPAPNDDVRSSCWHAQITHPYCD